MTFYRHFCERGDFEISVITDNPQVLDYDLPYEYMLVHHGPLWQRLSKTRFSQGVHSWSHLVSSVPAHVMQHAREFGAEAIFTVAGSWSWMANMAGTVAKRLDVPLVGSFNDWWNYNLIYHPWLDSIINRTFKQFYQRCDLAVCTSEGMQTALGLHPNSVVLYPTGATITQASSSVKNEKFTVAFGGNLGDWYGQMLQALVSSAWELNSDIEFKIFGSNASWSDAFDDDVRTRKNFHGQVPFVQLQREMKDVDALLLLMGFEESCAQVERTSFKTKFLDYLSFQKPILLWGPEYCSAVRIAQEFDSAEICISPHAQDFLTTVQQVQRSSNRQQQLVKNARNMYEERFHPDKIHHCLVAHMKELLA